MRLIRNLLLSFSMVITVVCGGLVFDVASSTNDTIDIHKVLAGVLIGGGLFGIGLTLIRSREAG